MRRALLEGRGLDRPAIRQEDPELSTTLAKASRPGRGQAVPGQAVSTLPASGSRSKPRSIINACPQAPQTAKLLHWRAGLLEANLSRSLWRKSEQWFCLTRAHAALVDSDEALLAAMNKSGTKFPDEHYIPSLLALRGQGEPSQITCASGFTATDWSRKSVAAPRPVHPRTYAHDVVKATLAAFRQKELRWQLGDPAVRTSLSFGQGALIEGGCSGSPLCACPSAHLLMSPVCGMQRTRCPVAL
jgi:hypothetical protein